MPTYVVLGIGARAVDFRGETWEFPGGRIGWIRWDDPDTYPVTNMSSDEIRPDINDEVVRLDYAPNAGRFTITTDADEPTGGELAAAVADGMAGIIQANSIFPVEFSVTPALESEWIARGEVRLPDLEDRDGWMTPFGLPASARTGIVLDPEIHRRAVEWIEPMLRKPNWRKVGPFPAVIYYRLSVMDIVFGPHETREVIEDGSLQPVSPYEMAIAERSFHAVYKGLEALIGGKPSKDDERLHRRLAEAGIDPDATVVIPDDRDESMLTRFRHLESVRDTLAAHGGNTGADRSLTYYDVMEAQWVLGNAIHEVVVGRLTTT